MNMTPVEFSDNGQIEELMAQTKGFFFNSFIYSSYEKNKIANV